MGVPDRVGRYRVVRLLGTGASSSVFLGRDDELDADVAIKVLAENLARREDVVARFLAQARTLRGLNDPHVIGVHDVGMLDNGQPYFVMDVAPGPTIAEEGVEDLYPQALAESVGALHRHGIVHGDLKPSNIFVAEDRLVLGDLGAEGSGTPGYMAPEQARGEPIDVRTDVYACSAMVRSWITPERRFRKAIARGMAENPDDRPQTMDEWMHDLDHAARRPARVRRYLVGAIVAFLLGTIVVAMILDAAGDEKYTVDSGAHRVLLGGDPFAGTGEPGDGGDGGPALNAQLNRPSAVAVAPDGTVYIADTANNRIRAVDTNGIIRTVAGTGVDGDGGDGDTAVSAELSAPSTVEVLPGGRILITSGGRLRVFEPGGVITAYDEDG